MSVILLWPKVATRVSDYLIFPVFLSFFFLIKKKKNELNAKTSPKNNNNNKKNALHGKAQNDGARLTHTSEAGDASEEQITAVVGCGMGRRHEPCSCLRRQV